MPGIVGLVTAMPPEQAERELHEMVDAMRHEPFYTSGTWTDPSLGVYVGWSAIAGSLSDRGPVRNARGDVVLVLSGEDFPATDVDDPDYLVQQYEADPDFPRELNGRFHGVVIDRRKRAVTLFNDRYGLHRLYYHQSADGFYFAAEAKAILTVQPGLGALDDTSVGEFLSLGCVVENRTLFQNIHVLPGASKWSLRDGVAESKTTYFTPDEWECQNALAPDDYYEQLRDVFARRLPRYFEGPGPIAISLTGGLDSRLVIAQRKPPAGTLPCYTFGGMFRDSQDVRVARKVAAACGQPHDVIRIAQPYLEKFATYAERAVYKSDGCVDVGRSAELYANERARHLAPVRMSGNFGGEVLRRVRTFKPMRLATEVFAADVLSLMQDAERAYARIADGHPLSFAVFRQVPWHHFGLQALEQTQVSLRSPYLDNELVSTVFRAPESAFAGDDACLRLISEAWPPLRRIATDRGVGGSGLRSALHTFAFRADFAFDYAMPQWLAHMNRVVPAERLFVGRHRFVHFRMWYRDKLSDYVRSVLLDRETLALPYVDPKAVEAAVRDHLAGRRNYTLEIHKLLTLALIDRIFVRRSAA